MSDLHAVWRSKSDDEIIDAMKDLHGFLPDAQQVIRAEFDTRGLTYRRTSRDVRDERHEQVKQRVISTALRYLYPREPAIIVHYAGLLCLVPIVLRYQSMYRSMMIAMEHGLMLYWGMTAINVCLAVWAMASAFVAFRPSGPGWTVIMVYMSVLAAATLTDVAYVIQEVLQPSTLEADLHRFFGIDLGLPSLSERMLSRTVWLGVWVVALIRCNKDDIKALMNVSLERAARTKSLMMWAVAVVITVDVLSYVYVMITF
jgi:hypothetical protein